MIAAVKRLLLRHFGRRKLAGYIYHIQRLTHLPLNRYLVETSWSYQKNYVEPLLKSGDVVIDIGSGNNPVPRANLLLDAFPDDNFHRSDNIEDKIPLIVCSVERTPLADKSVDFAICSHIFEHVPHPALAARELGRIARAGYLETPAYGKDILVGSGYMHKWQVVSFEGTMYFYEYSERERNANVESPMMKLWMSPFHHAWQDYFWARQDLFNAILVWTGQPQVVEYRRKPCVEKSTPWQPIREQDIPTGPVTLTTDEVALLEKCLVTPVTRKPMRFTGDAFENATESIRYPIRGKRVYFEVSSLQS